nr:hypothetical protein Iba_chr08fCG2290 [Ipomoea batatas]
MRFALSSPSESRPDLSYIPSYDLSIAHKLIDQQIQKAQVELGAVLLRISLTEAGLLATNKRSEGRNANKSLRSMGDPIEQRNKLEVRLNRNSIKGFQREQMSVAFNDAVPVFGFVDSFGGAESLTTEFQCGSSELINKNYPLLAAACSLVLSSFSYFAL